MAYLGIAYSGKDTAFLRTMVESNAAWLRGDRLPRFHGESFLLLYDSNTAREFAGKCRHAAPEKKKLSIYPVGRPLEDV